MFTLGRVVGRIWRGPFYLGPLTRPVSVGDALLKTFEVLWKALLIVALGVAGSGVMVLYADRNPPNGWFNEIKISVNYDTKNCPNEGYPLRVKIHNNTKNKNVGEVSFQIEAFIPGTTTNLADRFDNYRSDRITPPGWWSANCWAVPPLSRNVDPSTLEYSGSVIWASETDRQAKLPVVITPTVIRPE